MRNFHRQTLFLSQSLFTGFLMLGLFLVLPLSTQAAPGDLDPTFGNGGIVITDVAPVWGDYVTDLEVQPDGKILAAGEIIDWNCEYPNCVTPDPVGFINRYLPNGALDTSFGTGGKILFPGADGAFITDIALLPGGKIVAVGYTAGRLTVFRYKNDGTSDDSFGAGGKVITGFDLYTNGIVIQPDDKMVIVGDDCFPYPCSLGIVRLNANGSSDSGFGTGGRMRTTIRNFNGLNDVALQTDGKIIVTGQTGDTQAAWDYVTVRYNSNGSLDDTFGAGGIVITNVSQVDFSYNVAVQADGKVLINGTSGIVRYNANGSIDTSFAVNGIFTPGFGISVGRGLAIQQNGKIVAAGQGYQGNSPFRFTLTRLNPNGSPDTSFGTNGNVFTPIGNQSSGSNALALQPDGKIISGGFTEQSGLANIAIARYHGDAVAPRLSQFDFDGDRRADLSVFRPSDGIWYLLRSQSGFTAAQFGVSTDKIAPADFDGDGRTDIAVFRNGFWYWLNSSNNNFNAVQFGSAGDIPQPADFSGDGRAELAVFRGGNWFTLNLSNNQFNSVQFGLASDKPVIGDYDGDGRADYAVYRDGVWYLLRSTQGFAAIQFGFSTDKLVPADYDGDGKTDVAVYRDGTWYLLGSQSGFTAFQFGNASDIPAPADYDGDGKTDAAVYRDGAWYLRQSTNGFLAQPFGLPNDKPIPAAFLP